MTTYTKDMLKAGAAVICRCEGSHGIAMTHAEMAAAVLDATLGLSQSELDVIVERRRQVEVEGFTAEHDDQQVLGELGLAAALYAIPYEAKVSGEGLIAQEDFIGLDMVLSIACDQHLKPETDVRRRKVKAAAMLLAEIERLDRAAAKAATTQEPTP